MEAYLLIFSVILFGYWYWKRAKLSKNLPPGPSGFPILGYIPSMDKNQHIEFSKLKAKYGDIFCFYSGPKLFVVLSSYAAIKDTLTKHGNTFAARPDFASLTLPESPDTKGIDVNSGKLFTEFKQIVLSGIKSFVRSNGIAESIITNEIRYLFREIDKDGGKPTDIRESLVTSMTNVTWFWLFGERKDKEDDEFKTTMKLLGIVSKQFHNIGIEFILPHLFRIPFVRKIFQASTVLDNFRRLQKILNDKINELESLPTTENEFSFVQEWLKLYPKGSDLYFFYRRQLATVLKDLLLGGMETTAFTLQWAILYMMEYPNIQQKVQAEITEVIGKFNAPSMTDRSKMPYTEATILEINRLSTIGPFSVPYQNTKSAMVKGYTIPENSIIIVNLWENHHDPKIFPNPDEFNPDRFLQNGELKKIDELIPFSIGKRQCMGESLARMELFLLFTSLLQRYTFKKPEGAILDFSYDFAFLASPRPYTVLAIPS